MSVAAEARVEPQPRVPLARISTRPSLLRAGEDVGLYRLVGLLGRGGIGQVHRAVHRTLGRHVAIKLLVPEVRSDPSFALRLFAEARLVNEIDHENIVEIHDFVQEADGRCYCVMELLRGADLAATRERLGPYSLARVFRIFRQICSALDATHAKGVVHRDIKPENIFLVERAGVRDFVKILDFGIAKVTNEVLQGSPRTATRTIIGTPEYMSPEQAGGRTVDARSDLYSLGIILYWMLADRQPFELEGHGTLLAPHLTSQPRPLPRRTALGEPLSDVLEALVLRCLALEPSARFQSAGELARALEALGSSPPSPLSPRRRMSGPVIAAGLAAAFFTGFGVGPRTSPPLARADDPPPPLVAPPSPPVEPQPQAPLGHTELPPLSPLPASSEPAARAPPVKKPSRRPTAAVSPARAPSLPWPPPVLAGTPNPSPPVNAPLVDPYGE